VKKLIIEVRQNETSLKATNPNIPYTPQEIAADAVACAEAGAAIVHFHGRKADGGESSDPNDYRAAISTIRARSDVLIHTTLGQFDKDASAEARTAHVRRLVEEGFAPDIAPLDMGSFNIDWFDADARSIRTGFVYLNKTPDLIANAKRLNDWGIKPQLAIWAVPNSQLMGGFIDAGLIAEPAFPVFLLSGGGSLATHPATIAGLRAHIDLAPRRDIEWSVMCYGESLLPMLPEIVDMGGHISIGLGDYPFPALGTPTNADIVREVARIARSKGREIATPAEARELLKMARQPALQA
jgi:uncharacterized protein (DUF849 family)